MSDESKPTKQPPTRGAVALPLHDLKAEGNLTTKKGAPGDEPSQSKLDLKGPVIAAGVCIYVVVVGYLAIKSAQTLSLHDDILPYLIVFAGVVIFWVRQNFRFFYGMIEVIFGAFLCLSDLPYPSGGHRLAFLNLAGDLSV